MEDEQGWTATESLHVQEGIEPGALVYLVYCYRCSVNQ